VQWTDRTNQRQTVTIDSAISATAPTLGAMLAVPHRDSATSRNQGRHISVPPNAVDQGDGTSSFRPPGSPPDVLWVFNNLTGVMTVNGVAATRVWGMVRFDLSNEGPVVGPPFSPLPAGLLEEPELVRLTIKEPSWTNVEQQPDCYQSLKVASPTVGDRDQCEVNGVCYNCAVRARTPAGCGGQLNVEPLFSSATDSRICRYTSTSGSDYVSNANHPKTYCEVSEPIGSTATLREQSRLAICRANRVTNNLDHQHFLVIPRDKDCPSAGERFTRSHAP
jgi:hypothetical protein